MRPFLKTLGEVGLTPSTVSSLIGNLARLQNLKQEMPQ